jgi:hypothetical protein
MYRIYLYNMGWYSQREAATLEEAREAARATGFQSRVDAPDGSPAGFWCPIAGWRPARRP